MTREGGSQTRVWEGQGEGDWIKLNARQYGLYRVNYPPELWDRLAEAATKSRPDPNGAEVPVVPADDYAGLLDDAFALAQAGLTPISNFLNLTRYAISRFCKVPDFIKFLELARHVKFRLQVQIINPSTSPKSTLPHFHSVFSTSSVV